ncbi:hypothetical protein AT15_01350 [Kosmotoga arenicorallina S304]|uniref:Uncharacterized protein n=1 Tax=Kosmotoga arenicorallina S304 TaxID=1453497 RepID=A0A176K0L3_9BACT|nr:tetratricopeptide repeat protein [Kosmotoga arenicorallina]OAA29715.1 hypothetical protein AT15_01350 [Kosmotoga arenicorallina S304]
MEVYRIIHKTRIYDIDPLVPFAIAVVDLIYDRDLSAAKEDLKGTGLEKSLITIGKLSENFDCITPNLYAPIGPEEFKDYLNEAGIRLSMMKQGTFEGFHDRIMAYADRGHYDIAQKYLDIIYEEGVDKDIVAELKGTFYIEQGEIERGIDWLKIALKENPSLVSAYSTLGQTYFNLGRYEESIQCWEKELELVPNHIVTYFMLADAYNLAGKAEKAIEILQKLVDNDPNNLLAKYQLMELYEEQKEIEKAKELEKEILEAEPIYTNDIEIWARVQFKNGNYARVKKVVEKAIKNSSGFEYLKILLVIPEIKLGNKESAQRIMREFLDEKVWYYYGKKELFEEFLTPEERKVCELVK